MQEHNITELVGLAEDVFGVVQGTGLHITFKLK